MYPRGIRGWLKHFDFFVVDAICLLLVTVLAYLIVFDTWLWNDSSYLKLGMLLLFSDLLVYLSFDTMHNVLKRGYYVEFRETLRHCS